jgi:hypothetical protein
VAKREQRVREGYTTLAMAADTPTTPSCELTGPRPRQNPDRRRCFPTASAATYRIWE